MGFAPRLTTEGEDLAAHGGLTRGSADKAILFGSFRLLPTQRLLLEGDNPVDLGSRALDILITLVERAGNLVSKEELMARVWPKTFVEPANLTVHIARLRRVLGDRRDGNRYLINIPGRGYRFVAPVTFETIHQTSNSIVAEPSHNLPALFTRPIGRAQIVTTLAAQVPQKRLITLVGPGGIGKSIVGVTIAHTMASTFAHGIRLIDLAPLNDSALVPRAIASLLDVEVPSNNPIPKLVAFLRDKQMLLVFDGCEHVIEAAASLAVAFQKGTQDVRILATSREPLHVEGEHLYRLGPLELPEVSNRLTAADAMASPAVQLFVERTAAALGGFELSDAEAPTVADICSKLDGIPLAIESAAVSVAAFGLRGLAVHLNDPPNFLTMGKSTVSPRHLSLRAALDWGYDWLSEHERVVLRRLSIFIGEFDLQAASVVATGLEGTPTEIVECLTSLVKKSAVSVNVSGRVVRYRLLNTARAYLLERLKKSGEFKQIACRHQELLRQTCKHGDPTNLTTYMRLQRDRTHIGEARDLPISESEAPKAMNFA
jgi:predicted ATPase/DNA-binding winged helix-turn-helix (wHTH) protein